jgi:hypothetical protein
MAHERSVIRLKSGREKAVDILAINVNLFSGEINDAGITHMQNSTFKNI